jgi:glycosyltransferase involved in cell wall biosynthesis
MFDDLQSVHLFKDVGQVPFQLQKHFGYDAEIVCRRNEGNYLYLDDVLKGLKVGFHHGRPYRYLKQHARAIDVLMLFHVSTRTIYRGLLYKALNPHGCLYVKADMSGEVLEYAQRGKRNIITQAKRQLLFRQFVKKVDIVSFETERSYRGVDTIPLEKKLLLPNGFDPDFIDWYGVRRRTFAEKENLILLVGRHGDYAKNTELMLEALPLMGDLDGWRVLFVGPMTPEFRSARDRFLEGCPHLADKVVFTGQLDDKRELFDLYSRAKLLCLTSRWESWGMVCVEAMALGCVPVMTPVSSADDLTGNGDSGVVIDSYDPAEWSAGLANLLRSPAGIERLAKSANARFENRFDWRRIVARLDEKIRQVNT